MEHNTVTTALIADDEPLLRERLVSHLGRVWPELEVVAQARNGLEAIALFDEHTPGVVFLDVHMPGLTGVEAARAIKGRAQIVFVTAHDQYALQAFDNGALDYLVKPFDEKRLAETVQRLRNRNGSTPPVDLAPLIDQLTEQLHRDVARRRHLQWIKASVGNNLKLIPVDEIIYFRSDQKYTLVVWTSGEALIRKPISELVEELDDGRFVQIHRSVIVSLLHVAHVVRGANETADVHLRGRTEVLPVSRSYLHMFRQM
jgi:DNA-binding LytR/AlgR family response regulator